MMRVWFARGVLLYAALLFLYLAQIYLLHPETGIARFGVTLDGSPHSITFLHTSLGAMVSAMSITAIYGLTPMQFAELRNEGLSWLLFVAALWSALRVRMLSP